MTAIITMAERWREKTLPKRVYFIIFAVTFAIASFFMAWRDQFERAEKLQISLSARPQQPTIQVNVPPINIPPAQVVLQGPPRPTKKGSVEAKAPADPLVAAGKAELAIGQIANLIDTGDGIIRGWIRDNDTATLKSAYAGWVEDSARSLDSAVGKSYSIQFRNARGSAMMGCPTEHSVEGCAYWQDITGKKDMLRTFISEVRQRGLH